MAGVNIGGILGALGQLQSVRARNAAYEEQRRRQRQAMIGTVAGAALGALAGPAAIPGLGAVAGASYGAGIGGSLATGNVPGVVQSGIGLAGAAQQGLQQQAQANLVRSLNESQSAQIPNPLGQYAPGSAGSAPFPAAPTVANPVRGLLGAAASSTTPLQTAAAGLSMYRSLNPAVRPVVLGANSIAINPGTGAAIASNPVASAPKDRAPITRPVSVTVGGKTETHWQVFSPIDGRLIKDLGPVGATNPDGSQPKPIIKVSMWGGKPYWTAYDPVTYTPTRLGQAPPSSSPGATTDKVVAGIFQNYQAHPEKPLSAADVAIVQAWAARGNPFNQRALATGVSGNPLLTPPAMPPEGAAGKGAAGNAAGGDQNALTKTWNSFMDIIGLGGQSAAPAAAPSTPAAQPPSAPAAGASAAALPAPKTQAEFDALPSGTRFIDRDGETKVKP